MRPSTEQTESDQVCQVLEFLMQPSAPGMFPCYSKATVDRHCEAANSKPEHLRRCQEAASRRPQTLRGLPSAEAWSTAWDSPRVWTTFQGARGPKEGAMQGRTQASFCPPAGACSSTLHPAQGAVPRGINTSPDSQRRRPCRQCQPDEPTSGQNQEGFWSCGENAASPPLPANKTPQLCTF